MLKFLDDVFLGLSYLCLGFIGLVGLAVSFHYYPTITTVILCLIAISPMVIWLEKGLCKKQFVEKLEKRLSSQHKIFNRKPQGLLQAFKAGLKKGYQ